jgi:NAD(P)-dependent dehydrogenase (short-subunit alcohol dehydrogenase family)
MTDHYEIVRPRDWDLSNLNNLSGKTAIVTGANSTGGIGWHTAHQLALRGAKVYIGARSLAKANNAIKEMLATSPTISTASLQALVVDLSDFKQVRTAAQDFITKEARLDILINNATMFGVFAKDSHGIATSFSVNQLGPFLFTTTLLPLLIKTSSINPDVRIINVSSTALYDVPPTAKFSSLEDFNSTFASADQGIDDQGTQYIRYGYTKLANTLFTSGLQRRLSSDPSSSSILAMSLHPGGVRTDGTARFLGEEGKEHWMKLSTPLDGAMTPLFAAAHPEPREHVEKFKGAFLLPWGGIKEVSELARDENVAKELWEACDEVLGKALSE